MKNPPLTFSDVVEYFLALLPQEVREACVALRSLPPGTPDTEIEAISAAIPPEVVVMLNYFYWGQRVAETLSKRANALKADSEDALATLDNIPWAA